MRSLDWLLTTTKDHNKGCKIARDKGAVIGLSNSGRKGGAGGAGGGGVPTWGAQDAGQDGRPSNGAKDYSP